MQHDALGTGLWNYQLWVHKHPVRVYKDREAHPREPIDVYQRLVNANFNFNVRRARLMQDFSYLALNDRGKKLFAQFLAELENLDTQLGPVPKTKPPKPWKPEEPWKLTPGILEANVNA